MEARIQLLNCAPLAALSERVEAAPKVSRVSVSYVAPKNPSHQQIYEGMRERRVLEKLQEVLSPFTNFPEVKDIVGGV